MPGTSQGSSNTGAVMYQTAQGVVYATPSSGAVPGLPEGYILNLPQSTAIQAVHDPQQTSMYT